jgi:uncharacterized protein YciI
MITIPRVAALGAALALAGALLFAAPVVAQAPAAAPAATAPALPLFAVEIKVGPKWDAGKPPQEQAFFREHSAHLRRLREAGSLVMGARYSDKGLVILAAASLEQARALMAEDPSIGAGTFAIEVHPFAVFYSGTVQAPPRR